MAPFIHWTETQGVQASIQNAKKEITGYKHQQSAVYTKCIRAFERSNTPELIKWFTYAKLFNLSVGGQDRVYFEKIKKEWPVIQKDYPQLANKVNFLTSILSEHYTTRNDSAQICNRSALIAEFSYL